MKRFHLIFGLLAVIAFLLTGKYMDYYLGHLYGMPDGPRMLYRTRHIFILLAALLHLGIDTYFRPRALAERRIMQILESVVIVLAPLLYVVRSFHQAKLTRLPQHIRQRGKP